MKMNITPRIKGFLCTTAHPLGCAKDVMDQIAYVKKTGNFKSGPSRVLVIGASGGYGLASRISAAFGFQASTIGVFYERPAHNKRTASPGWYKSAAFTREALGNNLYVGNINGDAYSDEVKSRTVQLIKRGSRQGRHGCLFSCSTSAHTARWNGFAIRSQTNRSSLLGCHD